MGSPKCEKNEIDFLIVKDKKPFLPIEAKLSDETPSKNWFKWLERLGCSVGIQLLMKENVYALHEKHNYKIRNATVT